MRTCVFWMVILATIFSCVAYGQEGLTPEQEKRIKDLEKIVQEQDRLIQQLQNQLETQPQPQSEQKPAINKEETRAYTEQIVREYLRQSNVEEDAGLAVGYDSGFYIKSADGNFEMRLTGFVQFGLGIFENDSFDNNSIFANGVYLTNDFYFYDQWHARIQVDFTGFRDNGFDAVNEQGGGGLFQNAADFEPRLRDAYVEYICIPEFQVRVGQTHVPLTIEGQYGENEGLTIFAEPFIVSWGHGRDPGIMVTGVLNDSFEYKASVHNGEGENNVNQDDDFLYAVNARVYYMGKSKNPNSFIHVGGIRGRDDREKQDGDFGSASIFTGWGRRVFGLFNAADLSESGAVQGYRTAVDLGFKYVEGGLRVEGEVMWSRWQRDFDGGDVGTVRLAQLVGWGFYAGASYLINVSGNPEDGSGFFPAIKFSYVDLDDTDTDDVASFSDGQTVFTYTAGLGYRFNKHVAVNFNYVISHVTNTSIDTIGPKDNDGVAEFDEPEHAWFAQVTAQW